ncbi:MAG: hypothetical protein H0U19_10975 [Acidobacteria bacterium]|nr:hypothetical protein [Acidobacteriota bacterium]
MAVRVLIIFVVSIAFPPTAHAQKKSGVEQSVQTQSEAATLYRAGETARAIALLQAMPIDEHRKAVDVILAQQKRLAAGLAPVPGEIAWTSNVLRSLAALEMEVGRAAQSAGTRSGIATAASHMTLGRSVYEAVAAAVREKDASPARWYLAIGLEQLADARFADAHDILVPACHDMEPYVPLLVACGTIHETFAAFPYDAGMTDDDQGQPARATFLASASQSLQAIHAARATRKRHLKEARTFFERAMAADPADTQAPLRLANVRTRQGADAEAVLLLDRLLMRAELSKRDIYLARLFLGRVRERQHRLDAAAGAFDAAISTLMAQTALLARAHNAQRRGNASEAAAFAERAMSSGGTDDPWWAYRFGQYWLPRDLYKALREEARR